MPQQHKESFRLMQYQDENDPDGPIEWLWNSRDGVTPFMISSREPGDLLLKHINWQDDILAFQYVPGIGQRVFIDLTEKAGRSYLRLRIERRWELGGNLSMKSRYQTKQSAFDVLLPDTLKRVEGHGPDIVVVDYEMQRKFVVEREERRAKLAPRRFA